MSSPPATATRRSLAQCARPYRLAAGGVLGGLVLATGLALHLGPILQAGTTPIAAAQVGGEEEARQSALRLLQEQLRATATQDPSGLTPAQAHRAVAESIARQDAMRLLREQLRATAGSDAIPLTVQQARQEIDAPTHRRESHGH